MTPSYTPFDADKIAAALKLATPDGARGTVTYDGYRSRFTVLFHSPIAPKHYAAGEIFQAGVNVRSADDGTGSGRGSSIVWMHKCSNMMRAGHHAQDLFAIRHVGSVEKLAEQFRAGFAKALASIDHFLRAWGIATEENAIEGARAAAPEMPASTIEALPGLFRGLLVAEAITLPGREIEQQVADLVRMWAADDSSAKVIHEVSRASVINAITRYAHVELPTFEDPFASDDLERQASALLWGTSGAPAPLVWLPAEEATAQA